MKKNEIIMELIKNSQYQEAASRIYNLGLLEGSFSNEQQTYMKLQELLKGNESEIGIAVCVLISLIRN